MQKRFYTRLAALAVAILWLLSPALAADHRDAPTIDNYDAIDLADFYMFRNPSGCSAQDPNCKLVVVMTVQSAADKNFAATYHFQKDAVYRFNFSNVKDGRQTANIDFSFTDFINGAACPAPLPPCQTFTAGFGPSNTRMIGTVTQGTNGQTHTPPFINSSNGVRIFAGPRSDPFFFDLVGFNRTIASNPTATFFTGDDALKGRNVNAIVVEMPPNLAFGDATQCTGQITTDQSGRPNAFQTPCSAWVSTYLGDFRPDGSGQLFNQVDREGNPAVNTALVPAALKDAFNFGQPVNDPSTFAQTFLNSILALDKKFGTCPQDATSAASCNPNVPFLASVALPDTMKLAFNLPDGYPNGRQLADRTTDTLISLILQIPGFTDGTPTKTGCPSFPYLQPPTQVGPAQTCDP